MLYSRVYFPGNDSRCLEMNTLSKRLVPKYHGDSTEGKAESKSDGAYAIYEKRLREYLHPITLLH